jgi:hypothetical protein
LEKVMAYSPNSTNLLGRRTLVRVLAGIAVSTIAGMAAGRDLAVTPGCPEPDAQLFARWREFLNSEIELNAVQDARDLISWNARQAYPPKPDCIARGWVNVIPSEIDEDVEVWDTRVDMGTGRLPAAERTAEVEDWLEKCKEINIRLGLPELESAFKAAWDRQWAAFARFVATPATTLGGLAVKTSAIFYFEDDTRRAWQGMITHQKQLEPEQQILLTLRRDLLRMAGLPDDFAMAYAETHEHYVATPEWHET